jgi:hypothetical protein
MDSTIKLGGVKAALKQQPPDTTHLDTAVAEVNGSIIPYQRSLAGLYIVGSSMDSELAGITAAQEALWEGPDSLVPTLDYARTHDITADPNWPRIAASGIDAIDRFVTNTAIDKFVERARKDLGTG